MGQKYLRKFLGNLRNTGNDCLGEKEMIILATASSFQIYSLGRKVLSSEVAEVPEWGSVYQYRLRLSFGLDEGLSDNSICGCKENI